MRWLQISSMGAFLLAIVMVSFAPALGGAVFGIAAVLGAVIVRKMPSTMQRELRQDFRLEIILALAVCAGLLAMAFGPAVPDQFRGPLGLLWLALAYGCLAMLGLKSVRIVKAAMRRN